MALQTTVRPSARDPREPVQSDLDPLKYVGQTVNLCLIVRRDEGGAWRGRLRFVDTESNRERETAEILCGASEEEVWVAVRELRDHHLRDLYRSLD